MYLIPSNMPNVPRDPAEKPKDGSKRTGKALASTALGLIAHAQYL
jgi:hypothetical protein